MLIILFYGDLCIYCQLFKPIWERLKKYFTNKNYKWKEYKRNKNVNILSDDIFKNYNITRIPSIIINYNNNLYKYEGLKEYKDIKNYISLIKIIN